MHATASTNRPSIQSKAVAERSPPRNKPDASSASTSRTGTRWSSSDAERRPGPQACGGGRTRRARRRVPSAAGIRRWGKGCTSCRPFRTNSPGPPVPPSTVAVEEVHRGEHVEVHRRSDRRAEMRRFRDRADHAGHRRVDEVRERHGLAERIVCAEEAFGRLLRQHDAARLAQRSARVTRNERQVEDVEEFRIGRDGGQPNRAIAGGYRNVVAELTRARGRLDLRVVGTQIARRIGVRHRGLAKDHAAVGELDAARDHERAVGVREMTLRAAPEVR